MKSLPQIQEEIDGIINQYDARELEEYYSQFEVTAREYIQELADISSRKYLTEFNQIRREELLDWFEFKGIIVKRKMVRDFTMTWKFGTAYPLYDLLYTKYFAKNLTQ